MSGLCELGDSLRRKFENATTALVKHENEYQHAKKDTRYQSIKEDLLNTWRKAGNHFTDHREKCPVCTNTLSQFRGTSSDS